MTEPTATFTTEGHTPVLIEDWLPIRELGIESTRERNVSASFPPLSLLHVWWARAPLAAANGVTLAALLPVWSQSLVESVQGLDIVLKEVAENLGKKADFQQPQDWELAYKQWVLWICGVRGDSVAAQSIYTHAKLSGKRVKNPFTWKQAFKNNPSESHVRVLHGLLNYRWGQIPSVLDPTAGGGSLPFTSMRFGLPTIANDLNPVAATVLDATLRIPAESGPQVLAGLNDYGQRIVERVGKRLSEYYPTLEGEEIANYHLVNTVTCPRTGGPVPLAPNWWLDKDKGGVAARPRPVSASDGSPSHIEYEILSPVPPDYDPSAGTISRGSAVSPWDGLVVDSEYIQAEAQASRMVPVLFCVRTRRTEGGKGRWVYRSAAPEDFRAIEAAEDEVRRKRSEWQDAGTIPTAAIPLGNKTEELHRYGMYRWQDMFTERQLLSHAVFVEEWHRAFAEAIDDLGAEVARDVMTVLGLMQARALNFNSRLSGWQPSQRSVKNVFDRHDFAFKWTIGELEGTSNLYSAALNQTVRAFSGLLELLQRSQDADLLNEQDEVTPPGRVSIYEGSGGRLQGVESESVHLVNIDPPYYDNVMYSELADFFYVWERATLGSIYVERFLPEFGDKDNEAVANTHRFSESGKRKRELSNFDYQQKMKGIFAECHRALRPDGVMVVWFTHKRAEAWDTLATAMMESGFTIEASWPVATQPENALNHAKKNSAKSTIMLVCRKRQNPDEDETFFEDIEAEVRQAARGAVEKFEQEVGIGGVDLQLATYGPTLSVISRNWPVLSSESDETGRSRRLRPEEALDVARQEVARLRMQRLVGKDATFDPATDFWLMCWETFQAREFPYDEARKLALGVGYDVDDAMSVGLLKKKAGNVELVSPLTRGRGLRRTVDDAGRFDRLVDATHFMLVTYRDDKLAAARTWLSDSGYGDEQRFIDATQAAVNAVPRVRSKKGLTLDEAVLLEDAVVGLFGDEVSLPVEAEEQFEAVQLTLGG